MFRFIHAADLHLDTPFAGIGKVSERVARLLQEASLEAFDALIELTLAEDAAFLLLAGDLYDGAQRGIRAQRRFEQGLRRLDERGIATFIVHGNHDPLGGWSAVREWPSRVTVFGSAAVQAVPVVRDGETIATVHGLSHDRPHVTENLALRFRRTEAPGIHIGLLHANAGAQGEHAPYSPCSVEELAAIGLDYWALGHVHRRQILSRQPWVVYPGNLQGRHPGPGERGAKGALVVEVEGTHLREPRFVACDRIRFETFSIDIAPFDDVTSLLRALQERADEVLASHDGQGLILRAELVGRGLLYSDLRYPGRLEEMIDDLRREYDRPGSLLWWEDLRNAAASPLDRDAIRLRGDFSARLLEHPALVNPELALRTRFFAETFEPLDRFRDLLGPSSATDQDALLEEAAALALDLLEGD
ncbi:MAG: DNA repair exonuclease [bacterium]|nr:DNA repair exonuclease [bacterium]